MTSTKQRVRELEATPHLPNIDRHQFLQQRSQEMFRHILAGLVVVWLAGPALADPIFDNGSPDLIEAYPSDFDLQGYFGGWQLADDLSLSAGATTIGNMHWWGLYSTGNPAAAPGQDDFTIRIFDDNAGAPGTLVHSFHVSDVDRTFHAVDTFGFDVFEFSAVVPSTELDPDTTYWLSIVNDTTGVPANWFWSLSNSSAGNNVWRATDAGNWTVVGFETAFNLTAVPEPSTFLLAALGPVAFYGRRRRCRSA